ncbi:MAG: MBL fold metallo-hydrolase [Clostridiales bacterium]|nr:MBL fold metallo-hydrolase [Clostridiales bacterium]
MTLTVLIDNCLPVGSSLLAESGFAVLVACEGRRVLFDTGASSLLLQNAQALGVSLADLDYIVLSHHHSDHTGGLWALAELYAQRPPDQRPEVICHPDLFAKRDLAPGFPPAISQRELGRSFSLTLVRERLMLSPSLGFLTGIPRNSHEPQQVFGMVDRVDGRREPDTTPEEGLLYFLSGGRLFVLTGCTHSGVCNLVRHAKARTGVDHVAAVAGGLHLIDRPEDELLATASVLAQERVERLYAMHCTDLAACIALSHHLPVSQLRCGETLEF